MGTQGIYWVQKGAYGVPKGHIYVHTGGYTGSQMGLDGLTGRILGPQGGIWSPKWGYKGSQGLYRIHKEDIWAHRGSMGSPRGGTCAYRWYRGSQRGMQGLTGIYGGSKGDVCEYRGYIGSPRGYKGSRGI